MYYFIVLYDSGLPGISEMQMA